jgi:hypothetical protein
MEHATGLDRRCPIGLGRQLEPSRGLKSGSLARPAAPRLAKRALLWRQVGFALPVAGTDRIDGILANLTLD